MKTAPTRSFPRQPNYYPRVPGPEASNRGAEIALGVALTLALLGAVWYVFLAAGQEITPTVPEARLELLLSGAVTSSLSLGAPELKTMQCSPSGFQLSSVSGVAFPLELAFSAPASANSTFYVLGSNSDFALKLNGANYTLLSGTVTTSPGIRSFNASLVDAQSQPLQLSGRLVCS